MLKNTQEHPCRSVISIKLQNKIKNGGSIYRTPPGNCFSKVQFPRINVTEISECDKELSEKELYMFFMSMQNNTSHENGGLTKDFFISL